MKKINMLRLCLIVCVTAILIAPNMMSLTRTISDTGDDFVTFVMNSKGNYWELDGAADDVQIQAAIDDLGTQGWVKIPNGTWDLEADVEIKTNVDILGAGMNSTRLVMDGTFGSNRYGITDLDGDNNFSIQDLTIDADEQDFYSAIFLYESVDCLIQNVRTSGASKVNFYTELCIRMTVDNVHSTNMCNVGARNPSQAMTFSQISDSTMTKLYAYNLQETDVILDWGNCNNNSVGLVFIDATGAAVVTKGIKVGASTIPSANMNFDNINIKGITASSADNNRAFYVVNAVTGLNVNNLNIWGGSLYFNDYAAAVTPMRNINFNNVNIWYDGADVIYVYGVQLHYANNVTISNLNVYMAYGYPMYVLGSENFTFENADWIGGDYPVWFEDSNYFTLDNCKVREGTYTRAMNLRDCDYWTIIKTDFINNAGDAIQLDSAGTDGCQYFKILGGLFDHNLKGVDTDAYVDNYIISLNTFIDDTVDTAPGGATYIIKNNIGIADQ